MLRLCTKSLLAIASACAALSSSAFALPVYLLQWGGAGYDDGQFMYIRSVAVAPSGRVYVTNSYDHPRVQYFTSDGTYLGQWGDYGTEPGKFSGPDGLAVDQSGNVYVLDYNRVQKFTADGAFLSEWSRPLGTAPGQFYYPEKIAVDGSGNVYVTEPGTRRIQKFTNDGSFLVQWTTIGNPAGINVAGDRVYVSAGYIEVFSLTGEMVNEWTVYYCEGIAVGPDGTVFVSAAPEAHVEAFTNGGNYLGQFGNNLLFDPRDMATDALGDIYVADYSENRIVKFGPAPTPALATSWGRLKALYRH